VKRPNDDFVITVAAGIAVALAVQAAHLVGAALLILLTLVSSW
jgi:hypothetical protein